MDLEIITLNELGQRKTNINIHHLFVEFIQYCKVKKKKKKKKERKKISHSKQMLQTGEKTKELFYKAYIDSQTQKTNLQLPKMGGR